MPPAGLRYASIVMGNALKIALVVGSLLNAINQGEDILGGSVSWGHFVLNYLVPFCVATYGGFKAHEYSPERQVP